jgi:uncharacterized protein (DUF433 family)
LAFSGVAILDRFRKKAKIELTADLVRDLLRDQHPDLADLPLELGARGWSNQMWRLGDDLVVRIPRQTNSADSQLLNEHTWLPVLAPVLPLPVPVPLRLGQPSQRYPHPWIVTTWVSEMPADIAPVTSSIPAADALATFLTAMHRPAPAEAPEDRVRGGPLAHAVKGAAQQFMFKAMTDACAAIATTEQKPTPRSTRHPSDLGRRRGRTPLGWAVAVAPRGPAPSQRAHLGRRPPWRGRLRRPVHWRSGLRPGRLLDTPSRSRSNRTLPSGLPAGCGQGDLASSPGLGHLAGNPAGVRQRSPRCNASPSRLRTLGDNLKALRVGRIGYLRRFDMTVVDRDLRFDVPLYSVAEAARFLGVANTTFSSWAKGYVRHALGRQPVSSAPVLSTPTSADGASVPFITLAEGMVLAAIRKTGVPMQRIRPALLALQDHLGIEHALASQRLYSDGAEVLFDFAQQSNEAAEATTAARDLVVLRNGQRVFTETVSDYLQRIDYGDDGYARLLHLPGYQHRQVVVDPERSFGQPVFVSGGAKVSDVIDRFQAGESLPDLSEDFGVPIDDLEDALRVASRRAA